MVGRVPDGQSRKATVRIGSVRTGLAVMALRGLSRLVGALSGHGSLGWALRGHAWRVGSMNGLAVSECKGWVVQGRQRWEGCVMAVLYRRGLVVLGSDVYGRVRQSWRGVASRGWTGSDSIGSYGMVRPAELRSGGLVLDGQYRLGNDRLVPFRKGLVSPH